MNTPDEFEEYVAARWPRLVRSVMLMGCTSHEAEDVVQTALAKCYQRWSRIRRADSPDAYVHRALINTLRTQRRRMWRGETPTLVLPEPPTRETTTAVEDAVAVTAALSRLGVDQRTAIVLRYYSDMSERDIAFATGVAPGTVKSRLARGLRELAADPAMHELRNPS